MATFNLFPGVKQEVLSELKPEDRCLIALSPSDANVNPSMHWFGSKAINPNSDSISKLSEAHLCAQGRL